MATSTVEDYLKCILLEGQKQSASLVSMGPIAARLGVAPGTVTSMVKTLEKSGLVAYEPYSGVELTEAGRLLAMHVLRRHRLIELFLVRVLGVDWTEVHEEAELLEHAVSDHLIDRMDEMLGRPSADPHGDPIPDAMGKLDEPRGASLLGCPLARSLKVVRVTDQNPAFLQLAEREGLMPGSELQVKTRSEASDTVVVEGADGQRVSLGYRAASKIQVAVGTGC